MGVGKCLWQAAAALLLAAGAARAGDITVFGLADDRAMVTLAGGKIRVLRPGDRLAEGITLHSADRKQAVFMVNGAKQVLTIGEAITAAPAPESKAARVVLTADPSGHFFALGKVNGGSVRFLIDTGATHILLNPSDARRLGIDYTKGRAGMSSTAGGMIRIWHVKLDEVGVGDINVHGVDAVISEQDSAPFALLGMSFLQRMHMDRDGDRLTLKQRF